ncbi:fibrobacter succinogenes major paralogous domain-containing protein [Cytophagaceae bacterium ABcell3]|nr:fibrobacter succinogenes major paralogous domain-containing protein [Cytophagaceae bacterium ABcell3]
MVRVFTLVAFTVVTCFNLFAQAPKQFSYQAVIRNEANEPLKEKEVGIRLSILAGSPEGDAVFEETHQIYTNEAGLISLHIGAGDIVSGELASIEWHDGTYFIKTEADPDGGSDYDIVGVSQLLSVPYAIYSDKSDHANNAKKSEEAEHAAHADHAAESDVATRADTARYAANADTSALADTANYAGTAGKLVMRSPSGEEFQISINEEGNLLVHSEVEDIEGNKYKAIKIGSQIWMAENLRTSTYNNGDEISEIRDQEIWGSLTAGAWCYYDNDEEYNEPYGKLYNWYAVDSDRGLCPDGWRMPSEEDWEQLFKATGGMETADERTETFYMLASKKDWEFSNGRNTSGFNGYPAGLRNANRFFNFGINSSYWTSTEVDEEEARSSDLISEQMILPAPGGAIIITEVSLDDRLKVLGRSVRCIKEQ